MHLVTDACLPVETASLRRGRESSAMPLREPKISRLNSFSSKRICSKASLNKGHETQYFILGNLTARPMVKSRRMRWAGHVARTEEGRGVHKVLVGKPEGKRPLGSPRRRWEDNIRMDLQEVGRGCGDWMELSQDKDRWRALVSTVMNFRVP